MAEILNIDSFGNQEFTTVLNNQPLAFTFQFNGRTNKYMVEITNTNTDVTIESQSVEPYSVLNIEGLELGDNFIIPEMSNPSTDDTGEILYSFEDLGTNLLIVFAAADEVTQLESFGKITTL